MEPALKVKVKFQRLHQTCCARNRRLFQICSVCQRDLMISLQHKWNWQVTCLKKVSNANEFVKFLMFWWDDGFESTKQKCFGSRGKGRHFLATIHFKEASGNIHPKLQVTEIKDYSKKRRLIYLWNVKMWLFLLNRKWQFKYAVQYLDLVHWKYRIVYLKKVETQHPLI
jgi:hypothetical protein